MSVAPRSTALVIEPTVGESSESSCSFLDQHFRIGDDDSQNVVEIVSDASGKPSNGFHFLHVAKSLLDAAHVRDIFGDHFKI